MVALVFLYICASIFIYGGELNSVICSLAKKDGGSGGQLPAASSTSS
jgi:uncharacterized BrkB/YihY/UPF0761 family membrane protein